MSEIIEAKEVDNSEELQLKAEVGRLVEEVEKANIVIHIMKSRVGSLEAEKAILQAEKELASRK